MKRFQCFNKKFRVIIFTRHKMTTTKIYPFQLWEPHCKLIFYMSKGSFKRVGATLTMAMTMKTINIIRKSCWHFIRGNTKACARRTRVIKHCSHFAILWVHTQTQANIRVYTLRTFCQSLHLRERIKRKMT